MTPRKRTRTQPSRPAPAGSGSAGGLLPLAFHADPGGRHFSVHRTGDPRLGWTGLGGAVEVDGRLLDLADARGHGWVTKRAGILRLPVVFAKDRADFELRFEPWKLAPLAPRGLLRYATEQEWREHMRKIDGPDHTRVYE